MASNWAWWPQISNLKIVYPTVYSGADQRKHQISASLAFVMGIHRGPVYSPHKGPITWELFPIDDIIMQDSSPSTRTIFIRGGLLV